MIKHSARSYPEGGFHLSIICGHSMLQLWWSYRCISAHMLPTIRPGRIQIKSFVSPHQVPVTGVSPRGRCEKNKGGASAVLLQGERYILPWFVMLLVIRIISEVLSGDSEKRKTKGLVPREPGNIGVISRGQGNICHGISGSFGQQFWKLFSGNKRTCYYFCRYRWEGLVSGAGSCVWNDRFPLILGWLQHAACTWGLLIISHVDPEIIDLSGGLSILL